MAAFHKSIYLFLRGIHRKIPVRFRRLYYDPAWKMIAFYKACIKNLRPMVTILEGTDPSGRFPLAIAYAGDREQDLEYWAGLTLAPDVEKCVFGRKWLWQIKKALNSSGCACSMLIVESAAPMLKLFLKGRSFQTARLVGMEIDISEPVELTWRKHRCRQRADVLRRIRKNHLSYIATNDLKLFDEFYYNMYVPFITARHQKEAILAGYDTIRRIFLNGLLLLIKQEENFIAGQVLALNEKSPVLKVLGVKDGKDEYLRLGVIGAMYYFPILEMRKRGYTVLDIGRTRPFLTDGVTMYKKNLQSRLLPGADSFKDRVYIKFMKDASGLRNFLIKNPFLYCKKGRYPYRAIFVEDGQFKTKEDFDHYLQLYDCDGLEGTSVFVFGKMDTVNDWVDSGNYEDVSVDPAEALFSS